MSDLSIVIVTYNSAGVIRRCLDSIFVQEITPDTLEVIVVDNASTDETKEIVSTYSFKIRIIGNAENRGFAAAANEGASQAKNSLVLFLNPDVYCTEGSLKKMLGFFQEHRAVSIMGCRMLNTEGNEQRSCWKKPNLTTLIAEMFLPYDFSLKLVTKEPKQASVVPSVSGACMVVFRNDFEKLRGFDERFFMYYEDIDLCIRAQQAGLKTYYNPDATAIHEVGASSWKNMSIFFERFYRSKLLFFRKHYSIVVSLLAFLIMLIGISLRIVVYGLVGVLGARNKFIGLSKDHSTSLKALFR